MKTQYNFSTACNTKKIIAESIRWFAHWKPNWLWLSFPCLFDHLDSLFRRICDINFSENIYQGYSPVVILIMWILLLFIGTMAPSVHTDWYSSLANKRLNNLDKKCKLRSHEVLDNSAISLSMPLLLLFFWDNMASCISASLISISRSGSYKSIVLFCGTKANVQTQVRHRKTRCLIRLTECYMRIWIKMKNTTQYMQP